MIDTAIVFVSGVAADPAVRVGGLGLLDRALLSAARGGVRRCFVVGAVPGMCVGRGAAKEVVGLPPDAAAAVEVLHAAGIAADDAVLCIHASAVFLPQLLQNLIAAAGNPTSAMVSVQANHNGALIALPVATVPVRVLPQLWSELASDGESELSRWRAHGVATCSTNGHVVTLMRRDTQLHAVESGLLLALENPSDGRIDTMLNRKLSRPLSRMFLHWRLHPNHITLLSFLMGLLAAAGFARGTYFASLAGALLLQLSAVFDCCDGEVARVSFSESRLGHLLDISLDTLANAAIFLGIAYGLAVTHQLVHAPALGMAVLAGIVGSFTVATYAETCLPAKPSVPEYRLASRLVGAMTTRDFSIIVLLATLTGMLPWFLWGAAVGANVFWLLLLGLLLRGAAAQNERSGPDLTG